MTYCAFAIEKHFSRGVEKPLLYRLLPIRTNRVILFELVMLTFSPSSASSVGLVFRLFNISSRGRLYQSTSIIGFVKGSLMIDESCVFTFPLANLDKASAWALTSLEMSKMLQDL